MAKNHKLYVVSDPDEGIIFITMDIKDQKRTVVAAVYTLAEIAAAGLGFETAHTLAAGFATEFDNNPDQAVRAQHDTIWKLVKAAGVPTFKFCIGLEQTLDELQSRRRAGTYAPINGELTEVAGPYRP